VICSKLVVSLGDQQGGGKDHGRIFCSGWQADCEGTRVERSRMRHFMKEGKRKGRFVIGGGYGGNKDVAIGLPKGLGEKVGLTQSDQGLA